MAIKEYLLKDICYFQTGINPLKDEINGEIPFVKLGNTNNNQIIYKYCDQITTNRKEKCNIGDLLLCWSCSIGESFIVEEECFFSTAFYKICKKNNVFLNKYLNYYFIKNKKYIYLLGVGSVLKKANMKILGNYSVKLPNLDEQQQIINIIEPKEKLFLKYNRVIDISNLDNFKKSWNNLINIIEPFEKLKEKFNIKIKYLKDILHNHEKKSKEIDILSNWAKITTGKRNANYAIQNGKYRFFSCSINKIQFCNSFSFDSESLLLAGNGDIGNVIYFNGKFDAYQRTYVIQCKNFIGNIYFSLVQNKKFFESNSKGSVIKFLTLSTISNIKISLNNEINNIRLAILKYIFICEKIVFSINLIIDLIIKKMIN